MRSPQDPPPASSENEIGTSGHMTWGSTRLAGLCLHAETQPLRHFCVARAGSMGFLKSPNVFPHPTGGAAVRLLMDEITGH